MESVLPCVSTLAVRIKLNIMIILTREYGANLHILVYFYITMQIDQKNKD